jgi:hypothetical protein
MEDRAARIGRNEALFRTVNEEVKDLNERGAQLPSFEIVCECGSKSCMKLITVSPEEYEAVRSHSDQFFVTPGHDIEEVETVISRLERYAVVAKRPGIPTRVAEATDPRG